MPISLKENYNNLPVWKDALFVLHKFSIGKTKIDLKRSDLVVFNLSIS